ncbi:TlpA family protein disulfide reductase [Limibacter armeniacum]|uniref:TlpA family protein disulfide reductase n=1 Tax=Limibacter armeniacum TaxID=466084 RepID=UPI002FE58741
MMKRQLFLLCLLSMVCLGSCQQSEQKQERPTPLEYISTQAGEVPVYDFKTFEPLLHRQNDTTYVVNFWATWCKPCVEELPAFEQLNTTYKGKPVKVMLVSLDFKEQAEKKLGNFMQKKNIASEVLLLDDPDANAWINKVSEKWSGAIPATVIYKGNDYSFYEQSFDYELLEKELNKKL